MENINKVIRNIERELKGNSGIAKYKHQDL